MYLKLFYRTLITPALLNWGDPDSSANPSLIAGIEQSIFRKIDGMPFHYRAGLTLVTLVMGGLFFLRSGVFLHAMQVEDRCNILARFRRSRIQAFSNAIRFIETFTIFYRLNLKQDERQP